MQWIEKLDRDGWNPIIDELVWHLEQGRAVVRIQLQDMPESGVEFNFENAPSSFLKVERRKLAEFWTSAAEVVARFDELASVELTSNL
ncbi:hypothetical protein LAG73_11580 [Pseudoxanthomonas japonensis]|nr:hypothetical protein LAG73_11580 [Pseudoxanthomonas japonensis]